MAAEEEEEKPGKLWAPARALSRTSSDKDTRVEGGGGGEEEEEEGNEGIPTPAADMGSGEGFIA